MKYFRKDIIKVQVVGSLYKYETIILPVFYMDMKLGLSH